MDILFVRDLFRPIDFGGNRYPWEVTRRLSRDHRVRVVTARFAGPLPGTTDADIHHYSASLRTPLETFFTNALFSRIEVEKRIRARRPDVIVLSSYDVAFGHFALARHADIPTVYIYHSSFYSPAIDRVRSKPWPLRSVHGSLDAFTTWVEALTFRNASAVVAVSPFSKREIEHRLGRPDPRVRVIPTGVDAAFFSPGDRSEARARLGLPLERTILLSVGRMVPVKRYDRAIEAVHLLRREDPAYMLILAGTGPEERRLSQLASERSEERAVQFAGFTDGERLRDLYRAADIVLCTSDFENWSLAVLEALSTGTPVIGTPGGSIPDLLGLVDPSLIAPGTDPVEIAATVRAHLASGRREEISQAAREQISAAYTWDQTVEGLLACFRDVIVSARTSGARE